TLIIRAHFCFAKTGLSGGSAAGAAASRPFNPIAPHGLQKWFHFGTGSIQKVIMHEEAGRVKGFFPVKQDRRIEMKI
ncbi:MAG: hypothetical protein LBQ57_13560, partial [Spirochaetales bacterium]|nr:hypothetical protein [Spirochaetales bacterium]